MKVAVLLGFFDPVFVRVQKEYASRLQDQSVVWIGVIRPHGDANLRNFKELLFDRLAAGANPVLVLASIRRGKDNLQSALDQICHWARDRHSSLDIASKRFSYALDEDGVIKELNAFFDIQPAPEIFPDSLVCIESWCATELPGKVIIHPRAIDAAKKCQYLDIPLVYSCLRLLGMEYRDNRMDGGPKTMRKLRTKLSDLGVILSPSISLAIAKQQGDDYFVSHPTDTSPENRAFLDSHLKKGVDHDERNCLRIYFFWDKNRKAAVVGWLTSHLGTRH
jgi:hypothetical protein